MRYRGKASGTEFVLWRCGLTGPCNDPCTDRNFYFLVSHTGLCSFFASAFRVPKIFTAIAFDSGGVASGPMTATFLLPLAQGACEAIGGNVVTDAFGVVAMVAMTPLITIQILGAVYQHQEKKRQNEEAVPVLPLEAYGDMDIIEL